MSGATVTIEARKAAIERRSNLRYALYALALLPLLAPVVVNDFNMYYLNMALIYIILAEGLNVSLGLAGLVNLSHIAMFAIGGYGTVAAAAFWQVPYPLAILIGSLIAMAVGIVLAIPSVRLPLLGFALVTFTFGSVVSAIIGRIKPLGGLTGFQVPQVTVGPFPLKSNVDFFFFIYPIAVILVILCVNFGRSRLGRAMTALADSPVAAQAMGVNLNGYRVLAFAVSSFYAGVAGGLYAPLIRYLDPGSFGLNETVLIFMIVAIGGIGTFVGPILGVLLLIYLPELLRSLGDYRPFVYGALLTVVVIFLPQGVWGWYLNWREGRLAQRRRARGVA